MIIIYIHLHSRSPGLEAAFYVLIVQIMFQDNIIHLNKKKYKSNQTAQTPLAVADHCPHIAQIPSLESQQSTIWKSYKHSSLSGVLNVIFEEPHRPPCKMAWPCWLQAFRNLANSFCKPGGYPDHYQIVITCFFYHPGPLHKKFIQSAHKFLHNASNRQTNKPKLPKT